MSNSAMGIFIILMLLIVLNVLMGFAFKKAAILDIFEDNEKNYDKKEISVKLVKKNVIHMGIVMAVNVPVAIALEYIFDIRSGFVILGALGIPLIIFIIQYITFKRGIRKC